MDEELNVEQSEVLYDLAHIQELTGIMPVKIKEVT